MLGQGGTGRNDAFAVHILAMEAALLGLYTLIPHGPMRGSQMTLEGRLHHYAPYVRSVVRVVIALLFFEHGLSKLFGFPSPRMPDPLTLNWFAGAIEFVGGGLLAAGLYTRTVAFIISGEMAFAYFMSHAPRGFFPQLNGGDAAILYCFIFLYFVFAGAGPWSLDAWLKARRRGEERAGVIERQTRARGA
jgi:putative oxidoreductase